MNITLSQYTSVSLRVVHRPVRSVNVDKRMKPFLYVHACSKRERTTHDHPYIATVHLVEYLQFLLGCHIRPHDNDLVGRDTRFHEFLLDVLIKVEPGLLVLIVIGEKGYRSLILVAILQRPQCLPYGLVRLAVWVISGILGHQAHIDSGSLGYAIHGKRYMAVGLLLLTAHVVILP